MPIWASKKRHPHKNSATAVVGVMTLPEGRRTCFEVSGSKSQRLGIIVFKRICF